MGAIFSPDFITARANMQIKFLILNEPFQNTSRKMFSIKKSLTLHE